MEKIEFITTKANEKRMQRFLNILNSEIVDIPKLRELSWIGIPDGILLQYYYRTSFIGLEITHWLFTTRQVNSSRNFGKETKGI